MRIFTPALCALLLSFVVTGCIENKDQRGHMIDATEIEHLTPGVSRKTDVTQLLGSPSASSQFGEDTWYYVSRISSQVAFYDPKLQEQTVVAITFNDKDVVKTIDQYAANDARNIAYVKDETPTEGHAIGVMEQLLGNLGRFNTPE